MHEPTQRVVVTDFDMSFGNLVAFMVKAAIAAVPAVIILSIIGSVVGMLLVAAAESLTS